jgi:xanthine dehydrogenase molybdenum-binding subunit
VTTQTIEFELNGQPTSVDAREGESLLETLRNRCEILSPKDGCQPQGQCGCCLVLIDGLPKVSCVVPAAKVEGKEVLTLEGLAEEERQLIAEAFVAAAGLQCGYCIPGFALQTKRLLDQNPSPSREQIARALNGHLCRCTGYIKILDAVELIAAAKRGEATPQIDTDGGVGASLARFEGAEMVLGDRPYIDDMKRKGLLEGAVLLSPHARARALSIDTSKAKALPGVVAVATANDVPGDRWVGLLYPDWPVFVAIGEEARCVGDVIAAVAAEDEATAREALALIEVEYQVLDAILDPDAAMAEGAPQVNPRHDNVLSVTQVQRGNAQAALEASAHVVSGTWQTQRIEHLYLEPESALAEPIDDGKIRLYSQGQGIFDDRRQVAGALGIDKDQLEVELVPNGGAFGGKEDMSIQAQTALLAQMTGRPVRITLNREESIRLHPKRHPITMHYTVGCDEEGRLTAVDARMVGDTGAYASVGSKVLERAAGHSCGPYRVPNVSVVSRAVMTNNPPCGAMRGFGANQAHFGIDGAIDLLAEKLGLDTWEIRWRNIVDVGDMTATGQVLEKSVGVRKTLEAVKESYYQAKEAGRAVGIACGMKNSGIGNGAPEWGKARLVVEDNGTVSLYNGYTEMGQGLLTVLMQCAVEVTGLPATTFHPRVDSTFDLDCGQTTGSRGTLLGGRAVQVAAEKLKADLDAVGANGSNDNDGGTVADLAALVGRVYDGDVLIDDTTAPGAEVDKIKTHTSYGFATQVCILDEEGRVDRVIAAHDVGRAINPALCEGQVEGSVHMGLGYALTEELPCPGGMPATFKLRELGVLRARDMPEVEVILIEEHEPEGPFGAKGVGEIGLVPTASAVAGALAAFDGKRRYTLPMKDSPAAQAMSVGKIRGIDR